MRKHIKREDGTPCAGKAIPLVITRVVEAPVPPAANDSRHGKLNYLTKSGKPAKAPASTDNRVRKQSSATGKFFGNGEKLTAFVWLDEESAPTEDAAND